MNEIEKLKEECKQAAEHLFHNSPDVEDLASLSMAINRLAAAASQQAQAAPQVQSAPPGFVLMPEKLTEEMHAAGVRTIVKCHGNDDWPPRVYAAWQHAAPKVAQEQAKPSADAVDAELTQAAHDVLAERQRQMTAEGWTSEHDDKHDDAELARAAAAYALPDLWNILGTYVWPWDGMPNFKDERSNLVRAGALILAEIERLDRAAARAQQGASQDAGQGGNA